MSGEETKPNEKEGEETEAKEEDVEESPELTMTISRAGKTKLKPQMLCELYRVRKEMGENSGLTENRQAKPYSPDLSNDLNPYYNKFLVNYMIDDQGVNVPRSGFGQRPTALGLVEPEVSWRMDNFPGPLHNSILPRCFYQPKIWSKNVSGTDRSMGSTRLPPIPKVAIPRNKQPKYQHFNMNYAHVQPFRTEMKTVRDTLAQKRANYDYDRTVSDWQRMNLTELKDLPPQSRYHVKKAVMTYLGTSKGSNKAVKQVIQELESPEAAYAH